MFETLQKMPAVAKLTSHVPPTQFVRYLLVGASNTIIGYSSYAVLTAVLTPRIPHAYILAGVLASVLNITVSFLNYKWFVFKTSGNYLREWMRCLVVYSGGIALTTALLPVTVFLVRHIAHVHESAPYIAGALLMGVNVILSFLGHKKFSFGRTPRNAPPVVPVDQQVPTR
jgi:putative flippase GtrA